MKNNRRWIIVSLALLLVGGIWHASQHRPTGPAEGIRVFGSECIQSTTSRDVPGLGDLPLPSSEKAAESTFKTFRIATFNLHGCKGSDGRRDIVRAAKCLEGLDFAALEEVHGPGFFGGEDQAALLGKRLKMAWLFAPAVREWHGLESGNGLLTSLPVTSWHRIPLASHRDYSHRNVVLISLKQENSKGQHRIINILVTHVNRRYDEDRQAQLRAVIALFRSLQEPAILLGDLNSTDKDPQIEEMLHQPEIADAVGRILGSKDDPQRIDWIFCRGLSCKDAGILENDASDHPLVWAELE